MTLNSKSDLVIGTLSPPVFQTKTRLNKLGTKFKSTYGKRPRMSVAPPQGVNKINYSEPPETLYLPSLLLSPTLLNFTAPDK